MKTPQTLAYELAQAMREATRDNGDTFYKLADGSPDWMTDAVHAAHGDMMPDDWRYRAIRDVAGFMAEIEADQDVDESSHECCDQLVDVYTARLTAWLATNLSRVGYCDEAAADFGPFETLEKHLQAGQFAEYQEIYGALSLFLNDLAHEGAQ